MARVAVDPDACFSSEECVRAAPGAFVLGDDGISRPTEAAPTAPLDQLLDAGHRCPVQAITVAADDGTVLHAGASEP